ncbi:hypothetical protein Sjap_020292 [Stephania japonica]|uniref:Peptidase A1 domain-containing protein n=1 Tax=Stephania japonica TaxID=461633 RepID=A0AAP0F5P1_9MAGN
MHKLAERSPESDWDSCTKHHWFVLYGTPSVIRSIQATADVAFKSLPAWMGGGATAKSPSPSPPAATTPSACPWPPPAPSPSTWTPAATWSGSPAAPSSASSARAAAADSHHPSPSPRRHPHPLLRPRLLRRPLLPLPSDLCASARCPLESIELSECSPSSFPCPSFYYAYADGSFVANLYSHNVSIPLSSPHLHLRNFTFGCAHTALGEPTGVAGFGRGLLSLPAQLSRLSPQLPNRFSYCLVSHSFDPHRIRNPSPLILGRTPPTPTPTPTKTKNKRTATPNADNSYYSHYSNNNDDEFVYTPMLDNPKHPYFYCVGLEAVTVGETRIGSPVSLRRVSREGNGGMVVDSGTTFTMLPSKLHQRVVAEFDRRVGRLLRRATPVEDRTGLRPCYYYGDGDAARHVPRVVLHFGGNASVALPRRNYFFGYVSGGEGRVGCLMVMDGGVTRRRRVGPRGLWGIISNKGLRWCMIWRRGRLDLRGSTAHLCGIV